MCNLTFNVFAPVGFVREKAPEVGDARHRDGQKLLYNNRGLLLWQNLVGQQLSILHELIILVLLWIYYILDSIWIVFIICRETDANIQMTVA